MIICLMASNKFVVCQTTVLQKQNANECKRVQIEPFTGLVNLLCLPLLKQKDRKDLSGKL